MASRVRADCPQCHQSQGNKRAAITREYNARERAMLSDAKEYGWSESKTLTLSLRISEDLEAALLRLSKLSGGR